LPLSDPACACATVTLVLLAAVFAGLFWLSSGDKTTIALALVALGLAAFSVFYALLQADALRILTDFWAKLWGATFGPVFKLLAGGA
jgi:hypothetical protein